MYAYSLIIEYESEFNILSMNFMNYELFYELWILNLHILSSLKMAVIYFWLSIEAVWRLRLNVILSRLTIMYIILNKYYVVKFKYNLDQVKRLKRILAKFQISH